jgi:hypothetical protein
MKTKCAHLAMAALAATSLLVSTASAAFSGAIYTSYGDGTTVNANTYEDCELVFLNGGPQNANASGLPDGEYYFQVTNPNGGALLSTTPAFERRIQVVGGVIFGRAPDLDPAGYDDGSMIHHVEGTVNPDNGSKPVQLWHFLDTTNTGGVYKVWLIPVGAATIDLDGITLLFDGGNSKTDNFRCVHDDGGPGENEVIVFGRKYYDANANGVYDGGEEWTSPDRPQVTINLTWNGGADSDTAVTDVDGLWFYLFTVPEGETLSFTACEEVPTDYNQTGPLDDDSVTNPDPLPVEPAPYASAIASGGCWNGTITDTLGLINLNFGNVDTVSIGGVKFYDANANGEMDEGEVTIPGFKIILEITYPDDTTDTVELLTDAGGAWSYEVPVGSSVTACEVMPLGSWVQTAPELGCHSLEDVTDDATDLNFGNLCLGAGGGHTLGFWSNKNGADVFSTIGGLAIVNGLPLKKANGDAAVPFANYKAFRTWILNATATNMAEMLSAQLAAMALNVAAGEGMGFVDGDQLIQTGGCGEVPEFASVNDVIAAAIAALEADGYTPSGDDNRSYQECLKNALDDANNNLNFVQEQPCLVEYPTEEVVL